MVKGLVIFLLLLSSGFPVEIISDLLYTNERGEVVAEGRVRLETKDYVVEAERIRYLLKTKEVFAHGNVHVRKKDGTLEVRGKSAYLDTKTGKGYFLDAVGRFRRFNFTAKRVDRLEGDTFLFTEGDVTTCPPEDKELKVCFGRAKIGRRYVFSFGNTLRFFNIPVAYLPLVIFPVGERRSGLLPPTFGSNTYNTLIYIQPIYWVISEDKDATLTLDFRDRQAKGVWLEYRQALYPEENLYTRLSLYREPLPPGEWWEGRDPGTFRRDRFRFELSLRRGGWDLGIDLPSDPYFFEDVYFSQRLRTLPFTLNLLSYKRVEEEYMLFLNTRLFFDLTSPDNSKTLNLLPELAFFMRPKKLKFGYVSLTSSFTNFYRERGLRSKRFLFLPEIELPYRFFGLSHYTRLRLITNLYFNEGEEGYDDKVLSYLLEHRVHTFRDFKLGSLEVSNTFEFLYSFSPENFNNPQFDSFDRVLRENNLKLRTSSSFSLGGFSLGSLYFESGYNLLRSYRFPTDGKLIEEALLPLRAILSLNPFGWASLSQDVTYDPNLNILARSVSSLTLKGAFGSLRLSYVVSRNSENERVSDQYILGGNLSYRGLSFGLSSTYDNLSRREIYRSLNLGYRGACWSVRVSYRMTFYADKGDYFREIFLAFNLFNLKEFTLPLRRR